MSTIPNEHRYITDGAGKRVSVIVDLEEFDRLVEAAEELDDIRAYDEAKAADDDVIPFEQAVREIEQERE